MTVKLSSARPTLVIAMVVVPSAAPDNTLNVTVAHVPAAVGGVVVPMRASTAVTVPAVLSDAEPVSNASVPSMSPLVKLLTSSTEVSNDRSICPLETPAPAGSTLMLTENDSPGVNPVVDAGSMITVGPAGAPAPIVAVPSVVVTPVMTVKLSSARPTLVIAMVVVPSAAPDNTLNVTVAHVPAAVGGVVVPMRASTAVTVPAVLSDAEPVSNASVPSMSPLVKLLTSSTEVSNDRSICPLETPAPSGSTIILTVNESPADKSAVDAGSIVTDGAAAATPNPSVLIIKNMVKVFTILDKVILFTPFIYYISFTCVRM